MDRQDPRKPLVPLGQGVAAGMEGSGGSDHQATLAA